MPFSISSDNAGVVSPAGQVPLPSYIPPVAAPSAAPTSTPDTGPQYVAPGSPAHDAIAHQELASVGLPDSASPASFDKPPAAIQHTSPFDSDPGYYGATSAEQLGLPAIDTNLRNLITQRIVAYGDPGLADQAGFGLDPQAAAFARQNYLAGNGQLARIDKAHDQARRTIINTLAAHGLIDSGDTGYQIGNADQTYGNTVYDAIQSALADVLGYRNSAQQQRDALHTAKTTALENAYQFAVDHPGAYATDGTSNGGGSTATTTTTPAAGGFTPTSIGQRAGSAIASIPHQVVSRQLLNPYTTGRKRFG